jgi:hypothetical protein
MSQKIHRVIQEEYFTEMISAISGNVSYQMDIKRDPGDRLPWMV